GNDEDREQRRRRQPEQERNRQALKDRIEQNGRGADHGRERGEQDRLEAHRAGFQHHFAQRLSLTAAVTNEIDQQDRVANDDAGERDESDHRGRGERRTQQPVADQNPCQRERYWRQD